MRYLASWASPDGLLVLSAEARLTFERFRQEGFRPEAGGILLGFRRGPHFEVVKATPPSARDERRRASFVREPDVHQELAIRAWRASRGIMDHIGEWHTHSESTPSPSLIDMGEWAKVARRRRPSAPMLGIIVGTRSLYVAKLDPDGRTTAYVQVDDRS